jgi:hypothetical protein
LKKLKLDDPAVRDYFIDNIHTFPSNDDVQVSVNESKKTRRCFKKIDDKLNGEGIKIFSNGEIRKEIFKDGVLNGEGEVIFSDGEIRRGIFKDGVLIEEW